MKSILYVLTGLAIGLTIAFGVPRGGSEQRVLYNSDEVRQLVNNGGWRVDRILPETATARQGWVLTK